MNGNHREGGRRRETTGLAIPGLRGIVRLPGQHGHGLARSGELVGHLPRHVLDATGARDESFDHDCDSQGKSSDWQVVRSVRSIPRSIGARPEPVAKNGRRSGGVSPVVSNARAIRRRSRTDAEPLESRIPDAADFERKAS